jgi:hypothetical protein
MKFPPDPPSLLGLPLSPREAFTLGWNMAWAEKRIMRCPVIELWAGDDEQGRRPCPACGATVSGDDTVRGACQAVL